jgi:uncharacterized membrane protein YqjE
MEDQTEASAPPAEDEPGTARALAIHVLRMLETRVDAASIALQGELQSFASRLQFRLLSAAALFLSLWAGIVLLAIVLPPHLRIPVLSVVVVAFIAVGLWAHLAANRAVAPRDIGSMSWFFDSLKQDVEVLSRSLAPQAKQEPSPAAPTDEPTNDPVNEPQRRESNDLAA